MLMAADMDAEDMENKLLADVREAKVAWVAEEDPAKSSKLHIIWKQAEERLDSFRNQQVAGGGPQNEQRQVLLTKEAVREALEEDRESNKSVRVSDVNTEVWNIIQGNAKLELDVFNGTISVTPRQVPAFDWDERLEKTQADRYMPHLHKLMRVRDRSYRLMDANHYPQLLMDGAHQAELGYKFRGTTDVAVVDKVAYQAEEYKHGLRLLFELKKKPDTAATAQAKISLLLANIHSAKLKPLVVLTDLKEDYRFYWLDGRTIRVYPAPSSSAAWGLIDLLFESEEVTEGGVVPKTLDADVMPVAKRQRLVLEGAAAGEGESSTEAEGHMAQMFIVPVADTVLLHFKTAAKAKVDAAVDHRVDHGDTGIEPFWTKILQALRQLAHHAASGLLDALFKWRFEAGSERESGSTLGLTGGSEGRQLRKKLAVEAVFLEAASQLIGPTTSGISERQAELLEQTAFDWVLSVENSRYVELMEPRRKATATSLAANVFGGLSATRLRAIQAKFTVELEQRLSVDSGPGGHPRTQIFQLCEGMSALHLPMSSDAALRESIASLAAVDPLCKCQPLRVYLQLRESIDFLAAVDPLAWRAPVRKSQVHHALAEMLTSILQPNLKTDQPRSLARSLSPHILQRWYQTVVKLRANLTAWTQKQSKHAAVAYPLITCLVCLEDDDTFANDVDPLVDNLHRIFKASLVACRDKVLRTLVLSCLCQLCTTYLYRLQGPMARDKVSRWLHKTMKPVLLNLRKGNLQAPEQHDSIRLLCVTIANHGAPEYAIGSLTLELLQSEGSNWDATMIGLRALLSVVMTAPLRLAGGKKFDPAMVGVGLPDSWAAATDCDQLLDMIRAGDKALDAYGVGSLAVKVGMLDATAKGLACFTVALRCVPFVLPDHWQGGRMFEDLPAYTLHADDSVRQAATDVISRVLHALPQMRSGLIKGMAVCAADIPNELSDVTVQMLGWLVHFMVEWQTLLNRQAGDHFQEPPLSASSRLDLPKLEGIIFSLLCSSTVEVRQGAIEALVTLRALHRQVAEQQLSVGAEAEPTPTYLMDVIEEVGSDIAIRHYWDLGRWAELWRVWRTPADDRHRDEPLDLKALLERCSTSDDAIRWARCLSEILKHAGHMCSASVTSAYIEVCRRLQGQMYRNSSGQMVLLSDTAGDSGKIDMCRCYRMVAAACPSVSTAVAARAGVMPSKELVKQLLATVRTGAEAHQQAAMLALGYCHPDNLPPLFEEMPALIEDYSSVKTNFIMAEGAKSRLRRDEMRTVVAHIFRLTANNMPPGTLRQQPAVCSRMLEFISDTLRYLQTGTSEVYSEMQQLRFCLCLVARAVAGELGRVGASWGRSLTMFKPALRKTLFVAFSDWRRYRNEVHRAITVARLRVKDPEGARNLEADMNEAADLLEHAANLGMATMLLGPAFENEVRQHSQGRALGWIDRLFTTSFPAAACGPSKNSVARTALLNLLHSNLDLFDTCIDQCYTSYQAVSRGYFQVVAEVYAAHDIPAKPQILLSLVLYKIVEPLQEVRDDALHMLDILSKRIWKDTSRQTSKGMAGVITDSATAVATAITGPADTEGRVAVVIGNLQDSYQQFQYQLSAKLARDHPELSELLCIEMLTRQLHSQGRSAQHQVLTCLAPWCENLSFAAQWQGNQQTLDSLYLVTQQHGAVFPHEIERLWSTVAANKRNIIPILDFVVSKGLLEGTQDLDATLRFFEVAKRVTLFLARVAPQHTIDTLVYEIQQQVQEDDGGALQRQLSGQPSAQLARGNSIDMVVSRGCLMCTPADMAQQAHTGVWALEFHHTQWRAPAAQSQTSSHSSLDGLRAENRPRPIPTPTSTVQHSGAAGHHRQRDLAKLSSARSDISSVSSSFHDGRSVAVTDSAMLRTNSETQSATGAGRKPSLLGGVPLASQISGTSTGRGLLSRPELALCLTAEVAYEHDEDFRGHLPLLFHATLTAMDAPEPLVYQHAQQLLVNLLYSLSARHLELHKAAGAMLSEYQQVTSLIKYLQSMRGRRLWPHQDASLLEPNPPSNIALTALANAVVDSAFFESDLRERWAAEAMKWMLECNSRHFAGRSHQVYRALRPAVNGEACCALLSCLSKCLASPTLLALDTAVEIVLTLQVTVECLDEGRLVLYPQILLACFALLGTSYVHLWGLLLDLLSKVLHRLDLNDVIVQNVLLASIPQKEAELPAQADAAVSQRRWRVGASLLARGNLCAAQQLLVKGLFKHDTRLQTVQVMTQLAEQIANMRRPAGAREEAVTALTLMEGSPAPEGSNDAVAALLGDPRDQLAFTIFSVLPWLCVHFRHSSHAATAGACTRALARACDAMALHHAADGLRVLQADSRASLQDILRQLCPHLCQSLFPRFAKIAVQRMMEVLLRLTLQYQRLALCILQAIFEAPGLQLGPHARFISDSRLFLPVSNLLESQLSKDALQVLDAIMRFSDAQSEPLGGASQQVEVLQWASCIDDTGTEAKLAVDALNRIVDTWPGLARQAGRAKWLPFVDGSSRGRNASLDLS
eukprot:jgi/Astpho2/1080/fgenesh1_pg.00017_%23_19_t